MPHMAQRIMLATAVVAAAIVLPNELTFLFDIEQDKPHEARRDAWLKQQLEKARALRSLAR
jgi:hypothetical protein